MDTTDEVSYRVDNTAVLQVSDDGTLRALAQGEAVVTATCGTLQQSCHVTIEIPVESITLLPKRNLSGYIRKTDAHRYRHPR